MKKSILIPLLLLSVGLLAKPAIKFKAVSVDLGEIASNKIVDIIFEFENIGSETLTIKSVTPSCGCTTADLPKKDYKPGEKGTIASKFNTSGYNGKIIKTIAVASNDPDAPETRLSFSATVTVKDFAQANLKPEAIDFGPVSAGKTYARKLSLNSIGNQDLRIIEVSSGPEVSLSFKTNVVEPRKSTEISLTFTPFDKGTFNNIIKIRTNDYRTPYVFVRLEAQVD